MLKFSYDVQSSVNLVFKILINVFFFLDLRKKITIIEAKGGFQKQFSAADFYMRKSLEITGDCFLKRFGFSLVYNSLRTNVYRFLDGANFLNDDSGNVEASGSASAWSAGCSVCVCDASLDLLGSNEPGPLWNS